jgi:hypothetical protein
MNSPAWCSNSMCRAGSTLLCGLCWTARSNACCSWMMCVWACYCPLLCLRRLPPGQLCCVSSRHSGSAGRPVLQWVPETVWRRPGQWESQVILTAAAAICGSCRLDLVPAWRDGKHCWAQCMALVGVWYVGCLVSPMPGPGHDIGGAK